MTIEHTTIRSLRALAAAAVVVLLAACGSGGDPGAGADATASAPGGLELVTESAAADCVEKEDFSYAGEDGVTALDLLTRNDPTAETSGKGENAYVTSICGYVASDEKKEFWALYVDGEQAQVGAGTLQTEDGQEITWKLETY